MRLPKRARTSPRRRAVSRRPSAKTRTPRPRRRPISRSRSRPRYRASDIASAGSRDGDTAVSRAVHHYVPLLIRWPRELLARVDAEVGRRREKAGSSWAARSIYRAAVVRELVDAQLTSLESSAKAKAKGARR